MSPGPRVVRASGVLPYRVRDGALEVALVHRPRYDDWSWPKGKLDPGEDWAAAAARETLEETGLRVRLGLPLPVSVYPLSNGQTKQVRYWAGEVVGGDGVLEHEVDEVAWLPPEQAARRLSYDRDREQLDAVVARHTSGSLATWPLLVVRHAHAVPRGSWDRPDRERPLSDAGRRRVPGIERVLAAYAPGRILSSPAVRCVDTVRSYATAHGLPLVTKKGLSEETYQTAPERVGRHLARVLAAAEAAALCTHGAVLPAILEELWGRSDVELAAGSRRMLRRLGRVRLDKGEVLVCTMAGSGEDARVVAAERHRPST